MKKRKPPSEQQDGSQDGSEYERFERLAKQIIAVPKSELDKRQAAYERERARKLSKKRKAA